LITLQDVRKIDGGRMHIRAAYFNVDIIGRLHDDEKWHVEGEKEKRRVEKRHTPRQATRYAAVKGQCGKRHTGFLPTTERPY
jgi:hypothetical protein